MFAEDGKDSRLRDIFASVAFSVSELWLVSIDHWKGFPDLRRGKISIPKLPILFFSFSSVSEFATKRSELSSSGGSEVEDSGHEPELGNRAK